jgi:hypothetical protein
MLTADQWASTPAPGHQSGMYMMKLSLIVDMIVSVLLVACAPAATATPTTAPVVPTPRIIEVTPTLRVVTATPAPTDTPTSTTTPAATATATAIPLPIVSLEDKQGNTIRVVDLRALAQNQELLTNHEELGALLNLENPAAPIPQFASGLGRAGISVEPQTIIQGLNYAVRRGSDGRNLVLATFTLTDENNTTYTVGFVAEQNENGEWEWADNTSSLRVFADASGLPFGSQIVYYKLNDPRYTKLAKGNFNFFLSGGEIDEPSLWKTSTASQGYDYDYSRADRILALARDSKSPVLWLHLVDPRSGNWPSWTTRFQILN